MEKNKVGLLHHLIKYHRQNTLKCHVIQRYPIILCHFGFLHKFTSFLLQNDGAQWSVVSTLTKECGFIQAR